MDSTIPFNKAGTRLFFVDHLRAALVILVILHHLAVIYAANTSFYYLEPAYKDALGVVLLVVFQLLNQAYFMGFFFLISGYFTPGAFDRKGPAGFVRDRLLRLGIPLVVYELVLGPIASIGRYYKPADLGGSTTPLSWQQYPSNIGIGPLWFVAMLLIFDFGYAAWRLTTRNRVPRATGDSALPGYRTIGTFVLGLALASYLIRIPLPLGTYWPRTGVINFPSLAYFPQYLSFFILGTIASRCDWFRTIPGSMGKWGIGLALVATLILLPIALRGGGASFLGGGQWPSGVYALWDSTFSVGMCLGLIVLFRHFFDHPGRLGGFLSQQAFTVYVIHCPIIVILALALRGIHPEQLLKFGLAAIIGVPLCFAVAYLVRKIPLAARIL